MANWYYNNAADTTFTNVNNWWANSNGTGAHPTTALWTTSATQADNLLPVTGYTGFAQYFPNANGEEFPVKLGQGLTITGTCSVKLNLRPGDEDPPFGLIIGGNYTAEITNAILEGGIFSGNVSSSSIQGGTFSGIVNASNIYNGVFNSTATVSSSTDIFGGTFNCSLIRGFSSNPTSGGVFNAPVTLNNSTGITGGAFNSTFSQSVGNVSGGTFNGAYTQNSGNVSNGTFNGTYTRVAGNVTGGTFNNGIINQFYRDGFPPGAFVFGGYNPKALDVLGTGLV